MSEDMAKVNDRLIELVKAQNRTAEAMEKLAASIAHAFPVPPPR